jgi:signal transduction histidine kinase
VFNGLHYNQSRCPRVELAITVRDEAWVLEVRDNGVGIAAEYLAEIFKPLVRLHNASEYAGSGLGLTLARKAVIAQHGAIWCESVPDCGSTFFVQLPRSRSSRERTLKQRAALRDLAGRGPTARARKRPLLS